MTEPTKIVKGGFRATLALILSILALIFSLLAYSGAGTEKELKDRIAELQDAMQRLKAESAVQLDNMRNETAKALKSMSEAVGTENESRRKFKEPSSRAGN